MRFFLWLYTVLTAGIKQIYTCLYLLWRAVRFVLISLSQVIINPYMFNKDLDITYRFFRYLAIPEWISLNLFFTHLHRRVNYYLGWDIATSTAKLLLLQALATFITPALFYFYDFFNKEYERMCQFGKAHYFKRLLKKTYLLTRTKKIK